MFVIVVDKSNWFILPEPSIVHFRYCVVEYLLLFCFEIITKLFHSVEFILSSILYWIPIFLVNK